jgi:hypothetical protein
VGYTPHVLRRPGMADEIHGKRTGTDYDSLVARIEHLEKTRDSDAKKTVAAVKELLSRLGKTNDAIVAGYIVTLIAFAILLVACILL